MQDQQHQALWPQMIAALAAIDEALGLPQDGCNSTARTLAAIRALMDATPRTCEQLGMAVVDAIADDGLRNAAGGIYYTRVQEFATEVQRAFAEQNRLQIRGLTLGA
jgi:hypothetical protein